MSLARAIHICRYIKSDRFTDEEKGQAIYTLKNAETLNSVTKRELVGIIKYLFNKVFDVEENKNDRD